MKVELFNSYKAFYKWRVTNGEKVSIRAVEITGDYITIQYTGDAEFFQFNPHKEEQA